MSHKANDDEEFVVNFDFAIMAIFATYVFDVSTQVGVQRQKLRASDYWNTNEQRLNQALKGARTAMFQAVSLWLGLIIVTAIGISLPSWALDQRMIWILEGLSLLFSAVVLAKLSFTVAQWTGLYYKIWEPPQEEESHTLREVRFNARWSYHRIFGRYFFFLMPFYQGVNAITIPVSMIGGIAVGLAIDFGVYLARRKDEKYKRAFVIAMILVIVSGSSVLLAIGVYFIVKVWERQGTERRDVWFVSSLVICFSVVTFLHIVRWWISQKKFSSKEGANVAAKSRAYRPRMATSLIIEKAQSRQSDNVSDKVGSLDEEGATKQGGGSSISNGSSEHPDLQAVGTEETATLSPSSTETKREEPLSNNELEAEARGAVVLEADPEVAVASHEDANKLLQNEEAHDYETPSYYQMFRSYWTCCGCVQGHGRSRSQKAWSFLYWCAWYGLVGLSLYLVIVNLGATAQQEHAREKLPYVEMVLYETMDEGPVCAFDSKGEDSNITTFDDKDAAHAAGFLILHCGACAACSDWHNLRQEYATRKYLAKQSSQCAKKALFGGRDAVLDCLKLPPIDFQGQCAECWADDILCTKEFCTMIFLQSLVINSAGNFQVNEETITSAACEEAHCEAGNPGDFVYCSGATRRRMNVTSTIDRPGSQRCGIVDVDWATLFPE